MSHRLILSTSSTADSSSAPATWHRSAPALDTAGVGSGNPGEWSSITRSRLGLLAAAVLATGSRSLRGKERRRASTSCRLRRYAQGDEQGEAGLALRAPSNLYELLGVDDNADSDEIKKAYYDKMKICHPDIAGDDGEEICILLNDAYDLLSDPEEKEAYDIQLHRANGTQKPVLLLDPSPQDLSPTWDWTSKTGNKRSKPVYNGRPLSRSLHHKVAPEDQGEKWEEQKFVFVDEWTCIACRNCCDVAPRTFCIDADAGRARVFAQWGNSEELLDYAVQACPVDCIYWVSRDELQVLEYVTRDRMFETGNSLPCSMAARQGTGGGLSDPFSMASDFQTKLEEEAERRRRGGAPQGTSASVTEMQQRIQELFGKLSDRLRTAGWGT